MSTARGQRATVSGKCPAELLRRRRRRGKRSRSALQLAPESRQNRFGGVPVDAQGIIVALRLQPHPKEGGYFNEANDRSDTPSTFGGNTRAGVHIDGIILNPDLHLSLIHI